MQSAIEKAKPIKALILDVDGVLTSGAIFYDGQQSQIMQFHVRDGLGIKLIQRSGITVAIISGRRSDALIERLKELDIQHYYLGQNDKLPAYEKLKATLNVADHEIAYMGDDLPDLPLLLRAGLAITVPQAPPIVAQHVDFTTTIKAGHGAVREACEFIMNAQDRYQSMVQSYLVDAK